MGSAFSLLLEATLEHLAGLRASGVRFIQVDPAIVKALAQPIAKAAASSPASVVSRPTPFRATTPSQPAPIPPSSPVVAPARTLPDAPPPVDKVAALDALRQRALTCQTCAHLARSRTQVVFGVGDPNASLMFVGEAPGAEEDRRGEPFVGPAGQLLTRMIQAMGLTRETVYIANILKCRPDIAPGSQGNRPPTPEEMESCKPYLLRQIEIIQPRVIVALGLTAIQGLFGPISSMSSVRGRWRTFQGIPVMPTYHPSYLLRSEQAADRGYRDKRKTWEDMLLVLEHLELPISEKMRGYFLKPPTSGPTPP